MSSSSSSESVGAAAVEDEILVRREISEEDLALAEELKAEGNAAFKENHFVRAEELYTQALSHHPHNIVLYSNRALACIRMEEYGSAIADATRAIQLDPDFTKAYYRRGVAYFALGQVQNALDDFSHVVKMHPNDPDALEKYKMARKERNRLIFREAIAVEEAPRLSQSIQLQKYIVPDSYDGPRFEAGEDLTPEFLESMTDYFRNQKRVHLRYFADILIRAVSVLESRPNIEEIHIPSGQHVTVCGDTHGQFFDLLHIFEINGVPSASNWYIFNGDYVDRGSWSVEVVTTLLAYKVLYPNYVFLTRGNHETRSLNRMYGFEGEVVAKYNKDMFELFMEIFNCLPLACLINDRVLVLHGGLFSEDGVTLDQIRKIDRFQEIPDSGLMCEMLWSDPSPFVGRQPSKRGVAVQFGPDVTSRFLEDNRLELLVRSHEMKEVGYDVMHNGKCITIFSAPNYCDQMGNKGAFIHFGEDCKPKYTTFDASPHPNVRPMAYASSMLGSF